VVAGATEGKIDGLKSNWESKATRREASLQTSAGFDVDSNTDSRNTPQSLSPSAAIENLHH
jgi:hypothetical protein